MLESERLDVERRVLLDVTKEQDFQVDKWGIQRNEDPIWLTILMEEVGEASKEILDYREHQQDVHHNVGSFGTPDCCKAFEQRIYSESVQVAAVALSWLRDKALSGKRYAVRETPIDRSFEECDSLKPILGTEHVRHCQLPASHVSPDHRDSFGWWKV